MGNVVSSSLGTVTCCKYSLDLKAHVGRSVLQLMVLLGDSNNARAELEEAY